jgi:hypothetical protein
MVKERKGRRSEKSEKTGERSATVTARGSTRRAKPSSCAPKEKGTSSSAITFLVGSFFVTPLLGPVLLLASVCIPIPRP